MAIDQAINNKTIPTNINMQKHITMDKPCSISSQTFFIEKFCMDKISLQG